MFCMFFGVFLHVKNQKKVFCMFCCVFLHVKVGFLEVCFSFLLMLK